jgi:hypothetical protein
MIVSNAIDPQISALLELLEFIRLSEKTLEGPTVRAGILGEKLMFLQENVAECAQSGGIDGKWRQILAKLG